MTPAELVRSVTVARRVAPCPELLLRLADEPITPWAATELQQGGVLQEAPFWAHAWPGGLALARWALDSSQQLGRRRVLDFAAGCGVSAIAAARAGAHVCATELDPWALAAIEENAALNDVTLEVRSGDVIDLDDGWDVVLVGDVFYRAELASRVERWLRSLVRRGAQVLIGDPGRQFLPLEGLEVVLTCAVPPCPAWDSVLDRPARVWAFRPVAAP
jgi:predicted nicotinamide N-methyase